MDGYLSYDNTDGRPVLPEGMEGMRHTKGGPLPDWVYWTRWESFRDGARRRLRDAAPHQLPYFLVDILLILGLAVALPILWLWQLVGRGSR